MSDRHVFEVQAFGCSIRAAAAERACRDVLDKSIFPSFARSAARGEPDVLLRVEQSEERATLLVDDKVAATAADASALAAEVVRAVDEAVIGRLTGLRAVHAGAVAWAGRALLLPGGTHAGKSSLVAELLRRGATYYSDEYALIDGQGRLHAYPRPLLLRNGGPVQVAVAAQECNAPTGTAPAAVGWVVTLAYRPGCEWSVAAVPQSEGLLTLLRNTPHVLAESPEILGIFERAVAGARCYRGQRPDTAVAAEEILRLVAAA